MEKTVLDYDSLTTIVENHEILLPQKEFFLLYKLLSYPNKIFTRQQLMDEIWGMNSETDEGAVDVHINRLRDKFKDSTNFKIVTIMLSTAFIMTFLVYLLFQMGLLNGNNRNLLAPVMFLLFFSVIIGTRII